MWLFCCATLSATSVRIIKKPAPGGAPFLTGLTPGFIRRLSAASAASVWAGYRWATAALPGSGAGWQRLHTLRKRVAAKSPHTVPCCCSDGQVDYWTGSAWLQRRWPSPDGSDRLESIVAVPHAAPPRAWLVMRNDTSGARKVFMRQGSLATGAWVKRVSATWPGARASQGGRKGCALSIPGKVSLAPAPFVAVWPYYKRIVVLLCPRTPVCIPAGACQRWRSRDTVVRRRCGTVTAVASGTGNLH